MSSIYNGSELKENVSYYIQDIPKIGKDNERYIGLKMLFKYPIQSTAHGRITGSMKEIPIRSLINVPGYKAIPVRHKNAHGFAVTAQNTLGIPVGRAYLNPTNVDDMYATFIIDGKEIKLPLSILSSLVKEKEKVSKETTKEIKKQEKKSGIPTSLIALIDDATIKKDIKNIPHFLLKVLKNFNLEDFIDRIKDKEGVFSDLNGNIHTTIRQAEEANRLIRFKDLETQILILLEEETKRQFEEIQQTEN